MPPFKAKLIEDQRFYRLHGQQFFMSLLMAPVVVSAITLYFSPSWDLAIGVAVLLFVAFLLQRAYNRKLGRLLGGSYLEMDAHEIRVLIPGGSTPEIIPLDAVEKITVSNHYGIPGETAREVIAMFFGKTKENYLIVQQGTQPRRIDFVISSYLMLGRLRKLIETWVQNGRTVEQV